MNLIKWADDHFWRPKSSPKMIPSGWVGSGQTVSGILVELLKHTDQSRGRTERADSR